MAINNPLLNVLNPNSTNPVDLLRDIKVPPQPKRFGDRFRNMTPEKKQNWANALYLLGGALKGNDMSKDMAMLQQNQQLRTARDKANEIEELTKQYQDAIASGDLDTALAIGARLNPGSTTQALAQQRRDKINAQRPQVIDGGKYTVTYEDGMPVVTPNQAVIDAELAEAERIRRNKPLPSTLIKDELKDEELIDILKISTNRASQFIENIDEGTLEFGFGEGIQDFAGSTFGNWWGGEESDIKLSNKKAYQRFKNKLRDDLLAMETGTKTDDDARRAMLQLEAANTEEDVKFWLKEAIELGKTQIANKQKKINKRRSLSGVSNIEYKILD